MSALNVHVRKSGGGGERRGEGIKRINKNSLPSCFFPQPAESVHVFLIKVQLSCPSLANCQEPAYGELSYFKVELFAFASSRIVLPQITVSQHLRREAAIETRRNNMEEVTSGLPEEFFFLIIRSK